MIFRRNRSQDGRAPQQPDASVEYLMHFVPDPGTTVVQGEPYWSGHQGHNLVKRWYLDLEPSAQFIDCLTCLDTWEVGK